MDLSNKKQLTHLDVRILGALISLLVSFFTLLNPSLPNDDAYAYIRTAEIALSDGINAAIQYYSWAGYSLLIAFVSKAGIGLLTAAQLINAFFLSLLVYSFISIVNCFNNSKIVSILAAICILLYPPLNELRSDIIRDIAMWALSLFALWQFLLFVKQNHLSNFICFCLSIILATFFRAEAIVYLFCLPIGLLLDGRYECGMRFRIVLKCMTIIIFSLALIVLLIGLIGIDVISVFQKFISVYEPFLNNILSPNEAESYSLSNGIFGEYAMTYSGPYLGLFMMAGLLAILIVKLFEGIGGPFFWVLAYGAIKRLVRLERIFITPVLIFLFTNLAIVFGFIIVTKFVSARYSMIFCLVLILFVPLILDNLINKIRESSSKNLKIRALILFFGYCAFDSFISFGTSKSYINESLAWLETESPLNTRVVTNNHAIAYFSGRVENYDSVTRIISESEIHELKPNDLLILEMNYEMSRLLNQNSLKPYLELQAAFPSNRDIQLTIYKRVDP